MGNNKTNQQIQLQLLWIEVQFQKQPSVKEHKHVAEQMPIL